MAKACNITQSRIKTTITGKALDVAKTVDLNFRVNAIGEIFLPIDSKVPYKNANYKIRSIVDKAVKKANQELGLSKFGSVLGGATYNDGASIQVVVTPSLFTSYQVKYEELSLQEAFEIPVSYRPEGFYNEDSALALQELNNLEESLFEVVDNSYQIADTPVYEAPLKQQPLQLTLSLDKTSAPDTPDLNSIGFEETSCEVT